MTSAKTGEKILIIEDDPAILYGLCKNLRYEGYTVVTASDGNAGDAGAGSLNLRGNDRDFRPH